jgi:sigma-E factor negative regulatory protein RseB
MRPGILLLLAALCLPLTALAGESPEAWFTLMQQALKSRSYQGNIVYMRNGEPAAYRLVACADGYARLSSLTGPPREVIRGPRVAVRMRAGSEYMVVHEPRQGEAPLPFPPATQTPVSKLAQWYRFELGGWSRVAGEDARLVELVPRDHWRYGYRVWISRASDLPLRSQLVGSHGGILEQAFFTRVKILDEATARNLIGNKAMTLVSHAASAPVSASAKSCSGPATPGAVSLVKLPPGFRLIHQQCQAAPGGTSPVTHVVLSDGLNNVSVFVAPHHTGGATLTGQTTMGPVHAMGRIAGGFAVTVMGTVPMPTVSSIAESVRIKGP